MAVMTADTFSTLLEKSDVLSAEELTQAQELLRGSTDPKASARALLKAQLLTKWQAQQLLTGRTKLVFGKYKLLERLGEGGMGSVYLAEHRQMHRRVALKTLNSDFANDPAALKRLVAEARAIAALDHPNIIRAYDLATEDETYYIVMEYVDGRDLETLVTADGALPYKMAADIIRQAASGLAHAHGRGMIHRDIKPANLLIDKASKSVKILDLGIASLTGHEESLINGAKQVQGTVDYLAPEQALGNSKFDHRADLYSLGCTFYFALTSKPPFPEGTFAQKLAKHQIEQPGSIFDVRPDAPGGLVDICQRMMEKNPDDRFATAQEVADAISQWQLSQSGANPTVARGAKAVAAPPIARRASKPKGEDRSKSDSDISDSGELMPARNGSRHRTPALAEEAFSFLEDSSAPPVSKSKAAPAKAGKVAKAQVEDDDDSDSEEDEDEAPVSKSSAKVAVKGKGVATKGVATKGVSTKATAVKSAKAAAPGSRAKLYAVLGMGLVCLLCLGVGAAVILGKKDPAIAKNDTAEDVKSDAKTDAKTETAKTEPEKADAAAKQAELPATGLAAAATPEKATPPAVAGGAPAAAPGAAATAGVAGSQAPAATDTKPAEGTAASPSLADLVAEFGSKDGATDKPAETTSPPAGTKPEDPTKAATPAAATPTKTPEAAKPAATPPKPSTPAAPARPKEPLKELLSIVELPELGKGGKQPDTTEVSLGKLGWSKEPDFEATILAPGAPKIPAPYQFKIIKKAPDADSLLWEIYPGVASDDSAPPAPIATINANKDKVVFQWTPEVAKLNTANNLRNCLLQFTSGPDKKPIALRVAQVMKEAPVIDLDKPTMYVPLDIAHMPDPEIMTVEVYSIDAKGIRQSMDPSKIAVKGPAKTTPPIVILVADENPKSPMNLGLQITARPVSQTARLEIASRYQIGGAWIPLAAFSTYAGTTLSKAQYLKERIAAMEAKGQKPEESKKALTALTPAKNEIDEIYKAAKAVNKVAKLYFRVYATVEGTDIGIINTGPPPVPAKK